MTFTVGSYVYDKFYHPKAIGVVTSIKDGMMWVKFGDKTFRYPVDSPTLIKK